ncbi:hypothetical protein [Bifidobacterium gallicum]|nr:hypothetical protein [Bifidobacterium gallicum]
MPASPYQVKMPAQPQYPADQPTTALPPVSSTMPAAYPPQQRLPQGPQDPGNKKKLSPAAIVGIVAGALVLIALVVWGIVSITHRQDTPTASTTSTSQATPSPSDHSKDNGKDKDTDDLADELDEDLDDFSDLDDSNATRIPQGESLEEFLTSTGSLDMLRESIESQSNENASGTVRVQGDTLIIEFRLKTIRGDAAKEVAKADVFDDDDSIREQLESLHEYFPNAAIKVVVYDADGATVLERTYE